MVDVFACVLVALVIPLLRRVLFVICVCLVVSCDLGLCLELFVLWRLRFEVVFVACGGVVGFGLFILGFALFGTGFRAYLWFCFLICFLLVF